MPELSIKQTGENMFFPKLKIRMSVSTCILFKFKMQMDKPV